MCFLVFGNRQGERGSKAHRGWCSIEWYGGEIARVRLRRLLTFAGGQIPDLGGLVIAAAGELGAVIVPAN